MEHIVFAHDLTKADRVVLETLATDYSDHLKAKEKGNSDSAYASASDTETTGTEEASTNTKGGVNKDAEGCQKASGTCVFVCPARCFFCLKLQSTQFGVVVRRTSYVFSFVTSHRGSERSTNWLFR